MSPTASPYPPSQVRSNLFHTFGASVKQYHQAEPLDKGMLEAMVALAGAPSPSGPESFLADYARKYM